MLAHAIKPIHRIVALFLCSLISACALIRGTDEPGGFFERRIESPIFESASHCRKQLWAADASAQPPSFGAQLALASWNAQKSTGQAWLSDLQRLIKRADILLLQEAVLTAEAADVLPYSFVAVAEGFRAAPGPSGVLSASHVAPLASCSFIDHEPLVGTRKASNINRYPFATPGESLLVANIHSINFSLGVKAFQRQLTRLTIVLHQHKGPLIFAGDFNIWNKRRAKLVRRMKENLNLKEVNFTPDSRKVVFGYPLDRIYYRGLTLIEADTEPLPSSDHDALIAVWRTD